jgi:hypothetical protein
VENERLTEAERAEKERLEAERAENERLAEAERVEKERLEAERVENERLTEAERAEKERLEAERAENERLAEAERAEKERCEAEESKSKGHKSKRSSTVTEKEFGALSAAESSRPKRGRATKPFESKGVAEQEPLQSEPFLTDKPQMKSKAKGKSAPTKRTSRSVNPKDEDEAEDKYEVQEAVESQSESSLKRRRRSATDSISGSGLNTQESDPLSDGPIHVIFSGIESKAFETKIRKLKGVSIVQDAKDATHVITTSPLKRTVKLMVAINSGCKYVLSTSWLDKISASPSPSKSCDLHSIKDAEREAAWGCSLTDTLTTARRQVAGGKNMLPLFGCRIFVLDGVFGKKAPDETEFREIVSTAAGELISSLEPSSENNLIILATEGAWSALTKSKQKAFLQQAKKAGALNCTGVHSLELLFTGAVMRRTHWAELTTNTEANWFLPHK